MQNKSSFLLIKFLAIPGIFLLAAAPLALPETFEGAKDLGLTWLQTLPQLLEETWQEFSQILSHIWNSYIKPFLQQIWLTIEDFFL